LARVLTQEAWAREFVLEWWRNRYYIQGSGAEQGWHNVKKVARHSGTGSYVKLGANFFTLKAGDLFHSFSWSIITVQFLRRFRKHLALQ